MAEVSERVSSVALNVQVRLDMNDIQRRLSAEQIAAVMEGVGLVIAASLTSPTDPEGWAK